MTTVEALFTHVGPEIYEPGVETTGALTVTAAFLDAGPEIYEAGVGQPTSPAGAAVPAYVVKVVNIYGTVHATLTDAVVEEIAWSLNRPTTARVSFPRHAYTAAQVPVLAKELQIYRDGDLLFWGPILSADTRGADGQVVVECADPSWYFTRRYIDGPRPNRILNESFEDDLDGWVVSAGLLAEASVENLVRGTQAVRLSQADEGADRSIGQTWSETTTGVGTLLTFVAWFYLETFVADAPLSRGLYIEASEVGGVGWLSVEVKIPGTTTSGVWTRAECVLQLPQDTTWLVNLRLYCPQGTILWDSVQAVRMESLSTAQPGNVNAREDIAVLAGRIVGEIQRPALGKTNLNIGTHTPVCGPKVTRHYQWAEHLQADRSLEEFSDRADGFDWSISLTPTTRSFHTHTPRKGTDRTGTVTLAFGAPGVADYTLQVDGASAISRATILSNESDGPDREEGEYADTSETGGLILQDVRTAPFGATISSLDPLAEGVVNAYGRAANYPTIRTTQEAGDLIHVLEVGDLIAVVVDDGWAQIDGDYRIVAITLDAKVDSLAVTCAMEV